mmetsp:Transcript_16768/g.28853  ORF Transcript_16768/g.28853 Transcript_16768/m.28853 type:complete len:406 (-) Transcript_16768:319-1536(-)
MSFVRAQRALNARLLIRVGKLSRNKDLLSRNDLEGLGNKVGKRTIHVRLDISVVFLLEGGIVEVDIQLGLFLGALHDQHIVPLLSLSNGLIQRNHKRHIQLILLRQQKQPRNIIILDLIIVLGPPHPQEGIIKLNRIPSTRREEGTLVLIKLGNNRSGRLLDAGNLHNVRLEHLGTRGGILIGRIGIGVRRNVKSNRHQLIRPGLDRVRLQKLHFDLVPIIPGKDALGHLAKIEAEHLVAVLRFELLALLVGILQTTLSEDEVLVDNVGIAPRIPRGRHGVLFEGQAVQLGKRLVERVVISGGEAVESQRGLVLGRFGRGALGGGFGEDAEVAGAAEDGPEGASDGFFGEDSFGFDVVVVSHDGGFPGDGGWIGRKCTNSMTVKADMFPCLWLWLICHYDSIVYI